MIKDTYSANARAFFGGITEHDKLVVPEFCLVECTNILWKHVRFYGLLSHEAETLLRDLRRLPYSRQETSAERTANRVAASQLAVYDSIYVAVAIQTSYPLITVDQPQSRTAAAEQITLKPITDFT